MSAFIYYESGDGPQTARDLLALADSPHDVQHTIDDGGAFRVPEQLAERYRQSLLGSAAPQPTADEPPVAKKTTARRRTRKEGN